MSSLNLHPNIPIIVLQTGVFFANLYAVKKLMLEPYLEIQKKRQGLTVGAAKEAESIVDANESAMAKVKAQLNAAHEASREHFESSIKSASEEKAKILRQAEEEARGYLEQMRQQIVEETKRQKEIIPSAVQTLSEELLAKVLV